jgi:hypothetical protein
MAAAVIVLVAQYVEPAAVAQSLSRAMEMVAFLAGATGLKYVAQGERLRGGIPALAPNEIAFLCVIPILFVVWNALQGRGHRRDLVEVAALVSLIWLSQSRTSLVVLVVSVAIMLTQNRRLPVGVFMLLLVALPIITYVLFGTHLLGGFLGRGGTQDITTLDSRTVAWQTALSLPGDIWQQAFGGGLALTQIPVQALYRTVQDLDSSWISALVQGGVVGVGILAYWTASTVLSVRRSEAPQRTLWLGLITFVILRSFLESGLLEATPAFLLFILMGVSTGQSGAADPESVSAMELVPRRTAPLFLETTGPSQ